MHNRYSYISITTTKTISRHLVNKQTNKLGNTSRKNLKNYILNLKNYILVDARECELFTDMLTTSESREGYEENLKNYTSLHLLDHLIGKK